MARRNRLSKTVVAVLGIALMIGAFAAVYKVIGSSDPVAPIANNGDNSANAIIPDTKLASVKLDTPRPATQPVKITIPTTKPTSAVVPGLVVPSTPTAYSSAEAKALIEKADAKRKQDDPVAARKLLIEAVDSKKLTPAEHDDVLRRLSEINETVVFSPRKFLSDETAEQYKVQPGDLMQKIAAKYDITWKFLGRLNGISDPRKLQVGKSLKVVRGPFHALVNKTEFTLDVYMGKPNQPGSIFLKRFRVGLGESDSTPTGEWLVDTKLENPRYFNPRADGPRVIEPDDPANPLGERWIALTGTAGQALGKSSYGIHGTIDPASIGQKKSMGCIRMINEDVELVYDMLISGKSTVTVVE